MVNRKFYQEHIHKTRVDHVLSPYEAIPLTSATEANFKSDHLPVISDINF